MKDYVVEVETTTVYTYHLGPMESQEEARRDVEAAMEDGAIFYLPLICTDVLEHEILAVRETNDWERDQGRSIQTIKAEEL